MSGAESSKMGTMPVKKLVFSISTPIIISMLVQALYNVVDSLFVSRFDPVAMESLSIAFPIQNLMIAYAVGIGVGTNSMVSRRLGEKLSRKASEVANAGILLEIIGYVAFAILSLFIVVPFFQMQTGIPQVVEYGNEYLSITMLFGIGIFIEIIAERLLQSTGKTKLSMASQAVGAGLNIVLDPLLIFGFAGMPGMGVKGAAIATVIGQIAAGTLAIIFNITLNKELKLNMALIFKPHGRDLGDIIKIGLPSMILNAVMSLVVFVMNVILKGFSEDATIAYGIYFKVISFLYMPLFGLNNGLVPIFSYNYGSNQHDRIRQAYRVGMFSSLIYMVAGLVVFELFAPQILSAFNASPNVLLIGIVAFHIMALGFPMSGVDIVNSTLFQSVGKPLYGLIVTLVREIIVLIPISLLFASTGNLATIWWGVPIAETAGLIVSLIFLKKLWKNLM